MGQRSDFLPPYPALAAWRRRDGQKPDGKWQLDALWQAACCEINAQEAAALGQHDAWRHHMEQARRLLLKVAA